MATTLTQLRDGLHVSVSQVKSYLRCRSFKPTVVICDLGLPGMDGYEVARTMRADASLRSVRLVALSGYAQPEDLQRSFAAGFEAHLAKPASPEAIEQILAGAG
jgi:CheY-like chemotaxis protein